VIINYHAALFALAVAVVVYVLLGGARYLIDGEPCDAGSQCYFGLNGRGCVERCAVLERLLAHRPCRRRGIVGLRLIAAPWQHADEITLEGAAPDETRQAGRGAERTPAGARRCVASRFSLAV
jgi:hypothetical protein